MIMRMSKSKFQFYLHFYFLLLWNFLCRIISQCVLLGQRFSCPRRRHLQLYFLSSSTGRVVDRHLFQIPGLEHSHFKKMFIFRNMNIILWPTLKCLRWAGLLAMLYYSKKKERERERKKKSLKMIGLPVLWILNYCN